MFRSKAFFKVFLGRCILKRSFVHTFGIHSYNLLHIFLKLRSTFAQVFWTCAKVSRCSKRFRYFLHGAATQLFTAFPVLSARKSQLSDTLSSGFHTLCAINTQQSRKTRTKYVLCSCHHSWVTRKLRFCHFLCHCARTYSLLARYSLASVTHLSRTSFAAPFSDTSLLRHCAHNRVTGDRFWASLRSDKGFG